MHTVLEFLKTDTVVALLVSVFIFIITIFLVAKRWIGFSVTVLLLVFAITAGLAISNHRILECYLNDYKKDGLSDASQPAPFKKQITQAVEDVQDEVNAEKENLHHLMGQVDEIFDQLEVQKQKLQSFIAETREKYKIENAAETKAEESKKDVIK
ncbi:MAG: hypothetical protein H0W88_12205 [Parachlamydiaceae bacterium]|nr:hypothetical protein [Parachlamydiaceae bacterium]